MRIKMQRDDTFQEAELGRKMDITERRQQQPGPFSTGKKKKKV